MSAEEPDVTDEVEASTQLGGESDSVTETLSANQAYLKETVAVYAAVGLGLGLSLLLLGQLGSFPISVSAGGMVEASGATDVAHDGTVQSLSFIELYLLPLLVVGVATIVAFDSDDRFDDPRDGMVTGAVGSLAGAIGLTMIAGILFSIELPSDLTEIAGSNFAGGGGMGGGGMGGTEMGVSIGMDWVGLLTNGVVYGIAAAVTTGVIIYARTAFDD